jgi:hypothetical protein
MSVKNAPASDLVVQALAMKLFLNPSVTEPAMRDLVLSTVSQATDNDLNDEELGRAIRDAVDFFLHTISLAPLTLIDTVGLLSLEDLIKQGKAAYSSSGHVLITLDAGESLICARDGLHVTSAMLSDAPRRAGARRWQCFNASDPSIISLMGFSEPALKLIHNRATIKEPT